MDSLSWRYSKKFICLGCSFVLLAYVSDCLLDALLFEEDTFWEQIISPTTHEITIRAVFSTFILGAVWYGCHIIRLLGNKGLILSQDNERLKSSNRELKTINQALTLDLRSMVTSARVYANLIEEQRGKMDEETVFKTIKTLESTLSSAEQILDDLYQMKK